MQHISFTDNLHITCAALFCSFLGLTSRLWNHPRPICSPYLLLNCQYLTQTQQISSSTTHTRNRKLHFLPCVARATLYNKPPTGYPHGCTYPSGSWGAPPQQSTPARRRGQQKKTHSEANISSGPTHTPKYVSAGYLFGYISPPQP